jgi:hypothetical protein
MLTLCVMGMALGHLYHKKLLLLLLYSRLVVSGVTVVAAIAQSTCAV